MKKIFLLLLLFCCSQFSFAQTSMPPFDKIIFLGDSLTDDGKLFSLLFFQVPKSPPYFKGRFSNGPTWAEDFAKYFYDKYYTSYKVYAVGGATAVFHLPTKGFMGSSTLEIQTDSYLIDNFLRDKTKTLVAIWIGSNDYLYYQAHNGDRLTTAIANKIIKSARRVLQHGVKYLLVLNLPDSSLAPYSRTHGDPKKLHELVIMSNKKLADGIAQLKYEFPEAKIVTVDIYNILMDFMANPDSYNKKYNLHVTNITDSCWAGGYFNDRFFSSDVMRNEIKQSLMQHHTAFAKNDELKNDLDVNAIVSYIQNTPEIRYVYGMGKLFDRGLKPCANPNEYLFWDSMHPTEVVHRVLYYLVLDEVAKQLLGGPVDH